MNEVGADYFIKSKVDLMKGFWQLYKRKNFTDRLRN
jgi:hypothetical protein